MNSKLIHIHFLLLLNVIVNIDSAVLAQEIHYTYDAVGNRVHREYIILRLAADSVGGSEVQAKELAEEMSVNLFPNPTTDVISLSVTNLPEGKKATATVCDNTGRQLLDKEVLIGITILDFASYNAGIYHVKVSSGKHELFYKVMKK